MGASSPSFDHAWSSRFESVSCSPHSHPKEVLAERHTAGGPPRTILSPHSSQSSTTFPERPFIRPPSSRPAANFARHGLRHNVNLPRPSWRCASPLKDVPRKNVHPCRACVGAADRCWYPSEKPPSSNRLEDRVRGRPTALLHEGLARLHRLHRWPTFFLENSAFFSGRCWFRTSDLCRVKAALSR